LRADFAGVYRDYYLRILVILSLVVWDFTQEIIRQLPRIEED